MYFSICSIKFNYFNDSNDYDNYIMSDSKQRGGSSGNPAGMSMGLGPEVGWFNLLSRDLV